MYKSITNKDECLSILDKTNYELLDLCFDNQEKTRVIIKDLYGYKYDCSIYDFIKKKYIPSKVHVCNPFSLDNISLWLELNERPFILEENNIYTGSTGKLYVRCNVCGELFDTCWAEIGRGRGCPFCRGMRIGERNNLEHLEPDLMKEWSSNNKISPNKVARFSSKQVLWICKNCGYEWVAVISNRTMSGSGCPACAGIVVSNKNRFSILYSESAKEWHPTKNGLLTPDMFSYGSHKEVWWLCSGCGNEWRGSIKHKNRIKVGTCPVCTFENRSIRIPDEEINRIVFETGYRLLKIRRDRTINIIVEDKSLYKYDVTLSHFTEVGRGIAIIHKGNPYSFENIKRFLELNPKTFELCDQKYKNTLGKLKFYCLKCERFFHMSWSSLYAGGGCSYCTSQSSGENTVDDFLIRNNLCFIREYTFNDCVGDKRKLPFDFAIFIDGQLYKIIEVDGLQHFESVSFFGGDKAFATRQRYDEIKTRYCKIKDIELIRIPYFEFGNIELILSEKLKIT